MGARKKLAADKRKEELKSVSFAKLNNCPTSPRKMRLLADNIRGVEVFKAMNILHFSPQDAAKRLEKLLRSAIANWEAKNEGQRPEDAKLVVKEVQVDSGRMRPAPQGRGYRIRKRSNHVTLTIDSAK